MYKQTSKAKKKSKIQNSYSLQTQLEEVKIESTLQNQVNAELKSELENLKKLLVTQSGTTTEPTSVKLQYN